jgi:hypothetical protein
MIQIWVEFIWAFVGVEIWDYMGWRDGGYNNLLGC